ncbi:uncharacterized protein I303_107040 [Kwoniella dejecticola CBS 10117]|uniref:Uncharacterized protein n=1 Tax=Kwoniella dejecticola CBS 10117 TaxID=1296121 RepID=A0A1A5ZYK2_9TREE|nr:uncharacterized protein I303_06441 [Kwoniella dejecticola CBS 10117]OBR82884.1 hypothetical protein I303_06441 [Kwoniella dejecticola CBS 10117]
MNPSTVDNTSQDKAISTIIKQNGRFVPGFTQCSGTWTLSRCPRLQSDLSTLGGAPGTERPPFIIRFKVLGFEGSTHQYDDRAEYNTDGFPASIIGKNLAIPFGGGNLVEWSVPSSPDQDEEGNGLLIPGYEFSNDSKFREAIQTYKSTATEGTTHAVKDGEPFTVEGSISRRTLNTDPIKLDTDLESGPVDVYLDLGGINQIKCHSSIEHDRVTIRDRPLDPKDRFLVVKAVTVSPDSTQSSGAEGTGGVSDLQTSSATSRIQSFFNKEFTGGWWCDHRPEMTVQGEEFYPLTKNLGHGSPSDNEKYNQMHLYDFWVGQSLKDQIAYQNVGKIIKGNVHWEPKNQTQVTDTHSDL